MTFPSFNFDSTGLSLGSGSSQDSPSEGCIHSLSNKRTTQNRTSPKHGCTKECISTSTSMHIIIPLIHQLPFAILFNTWIKKLNMETGIQYGVCWFRVLYSPWSRSWLNDTSSVGMWKEFGRSGFDSFDNKKRLVILTITKQNFCLINMFNWSVEYFVTLAVAYYVQEQERQCNMCIARLLPSCRWHSRIGRFSIHLVFTGDTNLVWDLFNANTRK